MALSRTYLAALDAIVRLSLDLSDAVVPAHYFHYLDLNNISLEREAISLE